MKEATKQFNEMHFGFTDEQLKKYLEWNHDCDIDSGCIGGNISFEFTPTSLGNCVVVQCRCGERLDLTECEDW